MTRSARTLMAAAFATLLFAAVPASAAPVPEADVTRQFVDGGILVDQLRVVDVGGILIIRGRTPEKANAEAAAHLARSLGYVRIANLIQIAEPVDDARIERTVERELSLRRSLDGCRIAVNSHNGAVHVGGEVRHELQKDVALQIIRNIDGVRSVRSDLRRF